MLGRPSKLAHSIALDIQAKPAAIARLAALASRSAAFAPGRLTAGEADQSASVAISVPRSQASDCQSAARAAAVGDRVGGGEGQPDRPAAAEQVLGVRRGLVVAEHPQGRGRGRDRGAAEQQIEGDHVAIGEAQSGSASVIAASFPEGKAAGGAKWTAVTKTATKSPQLKSLSDYIQERFEEFSRSQKDVARYIVDHLDEAAFLTAEELARRASTSSSTVVRFSQALGFEGYPELQQAAIEEYRTTIATAGAANGGPLFSFDHSELEGSLSADYSNLEETARKLTTEQVNDSVAALATRSGS